MQDNIRDKSDDSDKPTVKRKKTEEMEDLDLIGSKGTTLKKIIFIDSTWNQTNKIFTDERLQGKKKKYLDCPLVLCDTSSLVFLIKYGVSSTLVLCIYPMSGINHFKAVGGSDSF